MHRLAPLLLLAFLVAACDSGGSGLVEADSTVTIAYEGRLADGTVFSASPGYRSDIRGFIPGFQAGLLGMAVGETKTFDIPPDQAYGANPPQGSGIPPNATLTFEVTVLDIE
ncbi:FKBP-type peptidyl-prolyl cis-trans isomerase [Rubrivirga sp.]|uniref:FKBP-type peptidyl-prolyl cis-trans isomerase n=1 Tax=Rubrivirga sp. TaxID=1885344 RepID=UPI003B52C8BF